MTAPVGGPAEHPRPWAGFRLVLVHAHPDDETITTGATMAAAVAGGAQVTLVTCTRGERGEVIPPGLAHLAAPPGDALGVHREQELAVAMAALGVRDHRFLDRLAPSPAAPDAPGYRDSGMTFDRDGVIVLPDDAPADAFARADPDEAAGRLAGLLVRLRPHVVVTYDPGGGYGHPDHVQAHRVATRAVQLAADRWQVPRSCWVVLPRSVALARAERTAADPANPFEPVPEGPFPSMVVADDEVHVAVDGTAFLPAKAAALRAHATQVEVAEPYFALSNRIGQPIGGVEYFRVVAGTPVPPGEPYAADLFAGLDPAS